MDETHLVIIGAGVAGLTAGCYAARAGYRTTILEMHDLPGGLCTSFGLPGHVRVSPRHPAQNDLLLEAFAALTPPANGSM